MSNRRIREAKTDIGNEIFDQIRWNQIPPVPASEVPQWDEIHKIVTDMVGDTAVHFIVDKKRAEMRITLRDLGMKKTLKCYVKCRKQYYSIHLIRYTTCARTSTGENYAWVGQMQDVNEFKNDFGDLMAIASQTLYLI